VVENQGLTSCLHPTRFPINTPRRFEALVVQVTRDEQQVVVVNAMSAWGDGTWPAHLGADRNAEGVRLGARAGREQFVGCLGWTFWRIRQWIPEGTDCAELGLDDAHGRIALQFPGDVGADASLRAQLHEAAGHKMLTGAALHQRILVAPGEVQITAQRDTYRPWKDSFEIQIGELRELRPRFHRMPLWPALAGYSASAVGLGLGVVWTAQLKSYEGEVDSFLDGCGKMACNWDDASRPDREARSAETRQVVFYAAGGALLVAATAYLAYWYFAR